MSLNFVTKTVHAYLDYPVALSLMATPFILSLGNSSPFALWLSVATGVAAFLLTLLTDHHLGVLRIIPYKIHLLVDAMVGLTFLAAPSLLGFSGIDALYYWLNGAAVMIVISLHKGQDVSSNATSFADR